MIGRAIEVLRESGYFFFPRVPSRSEYSQSDFWFDVGAAVALAAVLIPQSIAYALLAGLPPAHGLYAALMGGIGGAVWGSSRYLTTGPIAVVSLLTLAAVTPLADAGSAEYIALAAALALIVGVIQIVFGFTRLGFLVRLVPLSVLTAFSSAAAFVIILTQIPHLLGVPVSSGSFVIEQIFHLLTHAWSFNSSTIIMGGTALAALILFRSVSRKIPGNLIVLAVGIGISYVIDLPQLGVALAGDIPARLPISDIPSASGTDLLSLLGHGFVIALVGFMSAYATTKEFSTRVRERVSPDQELVGQGFANLLSGLFRGLPVGGSLSRTAVNFDAGARTSLSSVYASVIILCVILFFSSILSKLPTAVLAAVLVFAVFPLVRFSELRRMYEITRTDGIIGGVTFFSVFVLRLDQAILLGVILALGLYMRKVMWIHVVEVGFHPEWKSLVSRDLFPNAEVFSHMLILRIDAPIFYANVERLEMEIEDRVREYEHLHGRPPKVVALDFSGVNHMDVTGVEGFGELINGLHDKHIKLFVITPRRGIREVLERGRLAEQVRFVHGNRELRLMGEAYEFNSQSRGA